MLNQVVTKEVMDFAKQNRVNKTKLLEMVERVMSFKSAAKSSKKSNSTYTKSDDVISKVFVIAKKKGAVTNAELKSLGVMNPNYVTHVMVTRGLLKRTDETVKVSNLGRRSIKFEVVPMTTVKQ